MVPIISILAAIISIQLGASVAKQLFPLVGAIGATSLRISLAALMLTVIWRPWRGGKLTRAEIQNLLIYGGSLGVMNLFFYQALARIPLGITVALEFTGPLSVALASSRRVLDFVWAILAIVGILFILPVGAATGPLHTSDIAALTQSGSLDPLGVLYALGAGCGWAFYILFGQRVGTSVTGGRAAALGMIVAALVTLPVGLLQPEVHLFSWSVVPIALFVAVFSSALPYSLEMVALKKIPTQTFSILMSLEPVVASLFGLLFLRETLSLTQLLAIGCIVTASAGSALTTSERKKAASSQSPQTEI